MRFFRRRDESLPPPPPDQLDQLPPGEEAQAPPQEELETGPPSPEARVEDYLDENASLLTEVELSWMEVNIASHNYNAYEVTHTGLVPLLEVLVGTPLLSGPDCRTFIEDVIGVTPETARKSYAERPLQVSGANMEEVLAAEGDMNAAYVRAFATQYVSERKLEDFLSDDAVVFPFMERLRRLAADGPHGHPEFLGLLEVVAVHVEQSRLLSKKDMLEKALESAMFTAYPIDTFVRSVLLPEEPLQKWSTPFGAIAASAWALAAAVTMDEKSSGITKEDVARRVAMHFGVMTPEWTEAYEAAAHSHMTTTLASTRKLLQPFSRQGRLVSNYRGRLQARGNQGKRTGSSKKGPRQSINSAVDTKPTLDMNDIVPERAKAEPITAFAVLKGVGESAGKGFVLEPVGTIDDLMKSQLVSKFLKKHKDMGDVVRSFLTQISEDVGNDGVIPLHEGVSLRDAHGHGRRHSLKRFRGSQSTSEEGSAHPLASRVRIVFGVCEVEGVDHMAIKAISIRDGDTYD